MTGQELKAIRKTIGYTQADLGAVLDMARETIGEMERSMAPITKRTELAVKYVALMIDRIDCQS